MKTIKGICKNCGEKFQTGFFSDGSSAICMEGMGYCCIPCAIEDLLKRINKLEKLI